MKTIMLAVLMAASSACIADEFVSGYVRSDGTYVQPHFRSSPNSYKFDNYSSQGNSNPYTGQRGYKSNELSPPELDSSKYNYNNRYKYDYGSNKR
jgi:hypothetical protein